jgi:hypothetical protein
MQLPEKYKENFDVSSEGPSSGVMRDGFSQNKVRINKKCKSHHRSPEKVFYCFLNPQNCFKMQFFNVHAMLQSTKEALGTRLSIHSKTSIIRIT